MANQEHLDILKQGVEVWNNWREECSDIQPDLSAARLDSCNLNHVDFRGAYLQDAILRYSHLKGALFIGANLSFANLNHTDLDSAVLATADLMYTKLIEAYLFGANLDNTLLTSANLSGADLRQASLKNAILRVADFSGANLSRATLYNTDFRGANLKNTDFSEAFMLSTIFGEVDLSAVMNLETVRHHGISTIDLETIIMSQGRISTSFLHNAGIPDSIIRAIPSLVESLNPKDFYSCFISYSSKDEEFASRLHSDLLSSGVRCWFAPEDMKIGDKIRQRIDESIRKYDKLLLVFSQHSVSSKWVEFEVEAAMDKEQEGKPPVLFPVRLDNTVIESTTAWAAHIKRTRHIGDFSDWKNHDDYQKAFGRLLRDLTAEATKAQI